MLTKPLLALILAACAVSSTPATAEPPAGQPDEFEPGGVKPIDQHFCCQSVDLKSMTGQSCSAISGSLEVINSCDNVLYCPGGWGKSDGKVACD